jgi:hypothetical protein
MIEVDDSKLGSGFLYKNGGDTNFTHYAPPQQTVGRHPTHKTIVLFELCFSNTKRKTSNP